MFQIGKIALDYNDVVSAFNVMQLHAQVSFTCLQIIQMHACFAYIISYHDVIYFRYRGIRKPSQLS